MKLAETRDGFKKSTIQIQGITHGAPNLLSAGCRRVAPAPCDPKGDQVGKQTCMDEWMNLGFSLAHVLYVLVHDLAASLNSGGVV